MKIEQEYDVTLRIRYNDLEIPSELVGQISITREEIVNARIGDYKGGDIIDDDDDVFFYFEKWEDIFASSASDDFTVLSVLEIEKR